MGPVGGLEDGELVGGEGESIFGGAFFGDPDLGGGDDVVGEEEAGEVAELGEGLDAGLHEGGDAAEVVVGEDAVADGEEEVFGREGAEILAVEPLELGEVEDGSADADVGEDEVLDHLGEGELFGDAVGCALEVGGHASAHEAEEVEDGRGEIAGVAVVDERDGVLALGDLRFVEIAQQRHMPEARKLPAEGLIEQDVLGGGGDPLLGTDDVGDLHEVIVDDVGEVVGGEAVGLHEHLVVDVAVLEGDVAAELVAEGGGGGEVVTVRRDCEADGEGLSGGLIGSDLFRAQAAAGSGVAWREFGGELLPASLLELFGSAEAAVGGAVFEEDLGVLAVDFGALGLAVGSEGAADVGAFVPGEAGPAERVEDHLLGGGDEAGAVGVLDAEDELAVTLAGVDVVEQADVGGADVGVACGGGSDADANGCFRIGAGHDVVEL